MHKLYKFVSIILVITLLFSSCGGNTEEKISAQIKEYFKDNKYNDCLEYVNQLSADEKSKVNSSVLSLISVEFNELLNENKIKLENCYALDSIDNTFAENCRKLWNISKLFSITTENENYRDFVYLHYYAEMCNYTKYGEIYSLLKEVHKSGYLNKITDALYAYDNNGDYSLFESAYDYANNFNCDVFNPQEYFVEDYKNAHSNTTKALKSLCNGFSTSNINVIASSIGDLEDSLSSILYITDTLNAVHFKQTSIFNELSNGEINKTFNTNIEVTEREFSIGMNFFLDNIFGENATDIEEETNTAVNDEKISKNEALSIAINAINKTKAYKSKLNVAYTQNRNVQLTSFENGSSIDDAVELTKNTINNTLNETNGTYKANILFTNGTNGNLSLNSFIPPSDKKATGNADSIQSYNAVSGSGGYVIKITFYPEATSNTSEIKGVGSIINGFCFEASKNVSEYKSTYSTAKVMLTVNNSGLIEQMEYEISGTSDCKFVDDNGTFIFDAQFTFNEKYTYSFEY